MLPQSTRFTHSSYQFLYKCVDVVNIELKPLHCKLFKKLDEIPRIFTWSVVTSNPTNFRLNSNMGTLVPGEDMRGLNARRTLRRLVRPDTFINYSPKIWESRKLNIRQKPGDIKSYGLALMAWNNCCRTVKWLVDTYTWLSPVIHVYEHHLDHSSHTDWPHLLSFPKHTLHCTGTHHQYPQHCFRLTAQVQ